MPYAADRMSPRKMTRAQRRNRNRRKSRDRQVSAHQIHSDDEKLSIDDTLSAALVEACKTQDDDDSDSRVPRVDQSSPTPTLSAPQTRGECVRSRTREQQARTKEIRVLLVHVVDSRVPRAERSSRSRTPLLHMGAEERAHSRTRDREQQGHTNETHTLPADDDKPVVDNIHERINTLGDLLLEISVAHIDDSRVSRAEHGSPTPSTSDGQAQPRHPPDTQTGTHQTHVLSSSSESKFVIDVTRECAEGLFELWELRYYCATKLKEMKAQLLNQETSNKTKIQMDLLNRAVGAIDECEHVLSVVHRAAVHLARGSNGRSIFLRMPSAVSRWLIKYHKSVGRVKRISKNVIFLGKYRATRPLL